MKIFILIFTSIILFSCTSSIGPKEYTLSPCMDITYQKLLKMDIKKMTNSEAKYFKMMDKECRKYIELHNGPESEKTKANKNLIWILYGLGLVLVGGIIFSFVFKDWH